MAQWLSAWLEKEDIAEDFLNNVYLPLSLSSNQLTGKNNLHLCAFTLVHIYALGK